MERMPKPDYMSEQEYKDLEEMKDKVKQKKISAMDYAISVLRYTETDLKHSGHKTVEGMLRYIVQDCQKTCDKLTKDYIKKYPD